MERDCLGRKPRPRRYHSLLNTNLNEEKAADKKLSTVALRKASTASCKLIM